MSADNSGNNAGPVWKILCVDDETLLLDILTAALGKMGFEVLTATNINDGFALVQKHSAQLALVVSDVSMPGGDGYEFRRRMLDAHGAVPFVLMSGMVTRESALQALDLRISGFSEKPFELSALREFVAKHSQERVTSLNEDLELLTGFIGEARSLIDEIESLLLGLEDSQGEIDERLNRVFACAHTIKGTSGFFKPDTLHRFTHRFEDFISKLKRDPSLISSTSVGVLLGGLDTLRTLTTQLELGQNSEVPLDELTQIFAVELSPAVGSEAVASAADAAGSGDASASGSVAGVVAGANAGPGGNTANAGSGATGAEAKAAGGAAPATSNKVAARELTVSAALLNSFMEKSGELTVLRNMVNKLVRIIETERAGDSNVVALSDLLSEMHKVNGFIQDQVGELRKVPLSHVYKPLARTLRDLCVATRKQVRLDAGQDDLRIDHSLADILNKCLVHLLRNAVDHGVEAPADRIAAGKTPQGTIKIQITSNADDIVLSMRDDGRGIDPVRVRNKAIESGLITDAQANAMSADEIRMLIFEPGFSTAQALTDISGRGVGMDMVKGSIGAIGGSIELRSELGAGTEFRLRLPVPKGVMIVSSLLVRAAGHCFAIPRESVARVVTVESAADRLHRLGSALCFETEAGLLPIVNLADHLQLGGPRNESSPAIVSLRTKKGSFCLLIDEVLDIEDTVVKSVGPWFGALPDYAGATYFADGQIGLVLDVERMAVQLGMDVRATAAPVKTPAQIESDGESLYLLFDAEGGSRYASPENDVFRLETFSGSDVQVSGGTPVLLYRGRAVPLIGARGQAFASTAASRENTDALNVVMVQAGEGGDHRPVGVVVNLVHDLVPVSHRSLKATQAEGVVIVGGHSHTLLNLKDLARRVASTNLEGAKDLAQI